MKALIIEDREVNTIVLRAMLEGTHFAVADAHDGVDGLEAFAAAVYDIVFVDLRMPRLSGLDVIRVIRRFEGDRALTPIVVVTADLTAEARDAALEVGADAVVGKPISAETLFDAIVTACVASELRKAARAQDRQTRGALTA